MKKLINKIKFVKGLRRLCLVGILTGASLTIAGAVKESDKLKLYGYGTMVVSLITGAGCTIERDKLEEERYYKELQEKSEEEYYKRQEELNKYKIR